MARMSAEGLFQVDQSSRAALLHAGRPDSFSEARPHLRSLRTKPAPAAFLRVVEGAFGPAPIVGSGGLGGGNGKCQSDSVQASREENDRTV
jgi:hypothetical protein